MAGTTKKEKLTVARGSDLLQLVVQHNNAVSDGTQQNFALTLDMLWAWFGAGPNSLTTPMGIGSTDTNLGTAALTASIAGVPFNKAKVDAGTALGALGTIPASTWGVIAVDVVAAGTISYVSGAANYTTGYATEALAIAALPARVTVKARLGYITVLASASTWVAGTDALAGGSSGNPATTTHYYPQAGLLAPTGAFANAMLIPTVLKRGSTDTRISNSTAATYNANGLTNIALAAVAAGTAFTAGTVIKNQWAIFVELVDGAGTITHAVGPQNYSVAGAGYATEAQAIADYTDGAIAIPAGKCVLGYVTVLTKAATNWVAATDALAGGSSGNPASVTNYYSAAGITLGTGQTAAQIGNQAGALPIYP